MKSLTLAVLRVMVGAVVCFFTLSVLGIVPSDPWYTMVVYGGLVYAEALNAAGRLKPVGE
jgi:hypothetical protein